MLIKLHDFMEVNSLRHVETARVLGMSSQHLSAVMRRDHLPPYIEAHLETLQALSSTALVRRINHALRGS